MIDLTQNEIWFVTGSQHLYGPKTLEQVAANSREIAAALGASANASFIFLGVMIFLGISLILSNVLSSFIY
ncbi:MAG: hypothetical protein R6W69_05575 [Anaerolineales bacterium]